MTSIRALKYSFIVAGSLFVATGFWALSTVRVNLNGSSSLPFNAFVMWGWPKLVWHGAMIAAYPPPAYSEAFKGFYFTKEVKGLPGDIVRHDDDGRVCINSDCFTLATPNGKQFGSPLPEGPIPNGMVAAFGTSPDSLDSRYAEVGLFSLDRIVAVGVGTDLIPHWKDIKAWSDKR